MRHAAPYTMADFMQLWAGSTRHELAASDSETWRVADLLALADTPDRALWDGLALGYTHPQGSEALRARIGETYRGVTPPQIVVTAGAQEALALVIEALLGAEDHAVLVLPGYPPTEHALLQHCQVTGVALREEAGWALDVDAIAAALRPQTRAIVMNFPNNPTGSLLSQEAFKALVALCRQRGLWLINDEVYRLIDRNPHRRLPCVVEAYERGVSIDAVSKSLGLPGLRIGWLACRDLSLISQVTAALQWRSLCPSAPSETLAQIALGVRELLLARNRAIALANLAGIERFLAAQPDRFRWTAPQGSVVGYVRFLGLEGVEAFATNLASQHGVLVFPASVWASRLVELPRAHFRLGFGRRDCLTALAQLAHRPGMSDHAALHQLLTPGEPLGQQG